MNTTPRDTNEELVRQLNARPAGGQRRDDTGEIVVGIILFLAFCACLYFANGGH